MRVRHAIEILRAKPLLLARIDKPLRFARGPKRIVQFEVTDRAPDKPQLIVGVDDLEVPRQTRFLPMAPEQPVRDPMEGPNPNRAQRRLHEGLDTASHFRSGLVGEGDRQDPVRRGLPRFDEPSDSVGQNPCLTAAGTRENQGIGGLRRHRIALRGVERIDNTRDIHRADCI